MIDKFKINVLDINPFLRGITEVIKPSAVINTSSKLIRWYVREICKINKSTVLITSGNTFELCISGGSVFFGKNPMAKTYYIEMNPANIPSAMFEIIFNFIATNIKPNSIARLDFNIDVNISVSSVYNSMVFYKKYQVQKTFFSKNSPETVYLGSASGQQIKVYNKLKEMHIKLENQVLTRIEFTIKNIQFLTYHQLIEYYINFFDKMSYYSTEKLSVYHQAYIDLYGINSYIKYQKSQKTTANIGKLTSHPDISLQDVARREMHKYLKGTCFKSYNTAFNLHYSAPVYDKDMLFSELIERYRLVGKTPNSSILTSIRRLDTHEMVFRCSPYVLLYNNSTKGGNSPYKNIVKTMLSGVFMKNYRHALISEFLNVNILYVLIETRMIEKGLEQLRELELSAGFNLAKIKGAFSHLQ